MELPPRGRPRKAAAVAFETGDGGRIICLRGVGSAYDLQHGAADRVCWCYEATTDWKLSNGRRICDVSTPEGEFRGPHWSLNKLCEPGNGPHVSYDGGVLLSNSCIMS